MEAIVAGHLCLDIIPELYGEIRFDPGRLIEAGPATISTGGAVSNTGLSLIKLGIDTALIGKIGDDLFGQAVMQVLGSSSRYAVHSKTEPTSYTVVLNLSGQDRIFLHNPGCNETFCSADVPDALLEHTRVFHFGYPPLLAGMFANDGAELVDLFRRAKAAGATTSLDLSLPDTDAPSGHADWARILRRVLPLVDLFLPSIDELQFMLDRHGYERSDNGRDPIGPAKGLAERALDLGAKIVAIKCGENGIYMRSSTGLKDMGRAEPTGWAAVEIWSPAFEVEVAGTTGAGDAAIAGLLMGLLRGMDVFSALRAASATGACCCERPDATSGVRPWPETEARIGSGWQRRGFQLGDGWEVHPSGSYCKG